MQLARRQEFHCLVADCMFPKMNGVDLVLEIQKIVHNAPAVFLMSGIFKDRNFVKSAIERTGAAGFFTKPFEMKELLDEVDAAVQVHDDQPQALRLYSEENLDGAALVNMLVHEPNLHSVHLPMLYRRMQSADLSGELTMVTEAGDMNVVGFCRGQIFNVRTPDRNTYFGGLAVGFGFVSPEEVLEALREPTGKLLGQRLIDSMSLSPHAINVILSEQLALRLSQTVQSGTVTLKWENKRFSKPQHVLDINRYESLIADWMRSKIDPEWVRPLLNTWGTYKLQGHFHNNITTADTINDLLAHPDFAGDEDILYFFRQLINGNASIGARGEETRNFNFLEHRLNQMLEDFKSQNFFQMLGVSEKAHHLELNRAMQEMRSHFDPAQLPKGTPPALRVKATKVFQQMEQAYNTLSQETARTSYVMTLQNKRAAIILENEPIFRAAILELQNDQAKRALKRFEALIHQKVEFKDLRSYYVWAGLKTDKQFRGMTLEQVPPEERHSAPYMMARGIWHRQRGQLSKALEAFRTAHVLDPSLTLARKEIQAIGNELEKRGNRELLKEVTSIVHGMKTSRTRRGA
jgi:CheY-like chemotaxis protein